MPDAVNLFVSTAIKFFFLLTPFFGLTMFLAMTEHMDRKQQRKIAVRCIVSVVIISMVLFHFGDIIFSLFGITLDAFRIGAGALLFLSAVNLIRGPSGTVGASAEGDISVVPLAMPIVVGPATIGTLLVMGATMHGTTTRLIGSFALVTAILALGILFFMAPALERILGRTGLSIMTKITGLILSALSAQIIFTGVRNFLM
ncbi:multiple antibiotic resistance (MarC)-related protein [Oleidesulfovibrio alaskensis G20]|jgi:multiple antibiotic resistance protein|uniref:UPF0056 inner membrane protein n=1 Tax=Oleidesulfovibrio alaskensis (strain ATCC BAA-1058 / DSM 17464 / G20) TaxID=207559 RepID=Q310K9_OLEA2|nr:MarC family protein [Oleidesulfovibrio alaskensis]ABB38637.1 multiple antibiotic resistance (MarC)-related protein [Oleidesulfovibrio alaskensis G20]MBG0773880.1 MarC family protein [Oleidesulfovibrio alaskensis]MBL3581650.1 MarC family protein [Oleidesulfovibrio alaskensis]MBL3588129.1 MarC family protein [bacterium]